MIQINKYPRTQHLQGSRLQAGDEDLKSVPFSNIAGRHIVVEEKVDGANCGISFSDSGKLQLQSRGHYLTGGPREKHFDLFKSWANTFAQPLHQLLGNRYIMYGEWLYAKHTVFYTDLPHYFMEFDIYDQIEETFLSTNERKSFCKAVPFVHPVKVLFEGKLNRLEELTDFVGKSHFINEHHLDDLKKLSESQNLRSEQIIKETDSTNFMEGLYIKVEEDGLVKERYKWVRLGFYQSIADAESHWLDRPIVPNQLKKGVNIFI